MSYLCAICYFTEICTNHQSNTNESLITCYKLIEVTNEKLTWTNASALCHEDDKMLLSIVDKQEMAFIHEWLKRVTFSEDDRIIFIGKFNTFWFREFTDKTCQK